jgi:hypothetical protein
MFSLLKSPVFKFITRKCTTNKISPELEKLTAMKFDNFIFSIFNTITILCFTAQTYYINKNMSLIHDKIHNMKIEKCAIRKINENNSLYEKNKKTN